MSDKFPAPYEGKPLTTHPVVIKNEKGKLKKYPENYKPGKEKLEKKEIRVTALGTGYPSRRAQGCAGFMVETGNGEVFIFDAGAGTNMAFNIMHIPYNKANKFFISHYHIDHIADLPVYYDFGQPNGRLETMHVYGPEGENHDLGMESLIENMKKFVAWHDYTKVGNLDPRGFHLEAHQFPADKTTVVYDENGVVIKAYPVPHGVYGAVGYRLEYEGMAVVYAGDSEPSTTTVDNAQDVDLLIHENFNTPQTYVDDLGWTEIQAKIVAWTKHTSPEAAAIVFDRTKPGMAMGFHAMVAPGTPQPILDGIRSGYDGPYTLAHDFTVVNITPDQIVTRMADVVPWDFIVAPDEEYIESKGGVKPDPGKAHGLPEWLEETIIPVPEIEEFKDELKKKGLR